MDTVINPSMLNKPSMLIKVSMLNNPSMLSNVRTLAKLSMNGTAGNQISSLNRISAA
jgi:hypothetical protein